MGLSDWRPFVYGGVSACIAEFGTFPIDTTKTRLQIQGGCQDGQVVTKRYRGMLHALLRISSEEGFKALYFGIAPAVLRQATYGTIKFGIYYSLKKLISSSPSEERLGVNVFCGITAGVVSSAIANPADVLKVRLQSGRRDYLQNQSIWHAFLTIYEQEGIRGLWRGVCPTAQRAGVIVGVELPLYDMCKHYFIRMDLLRDNAVNHLLSSFIASLGGAIASTPIDVVRTRLMNQRTLRPSVVAAAALASGGEVYASRLYRGSLDCLVQTVKLEGPLALYKGFIPTWLRLGPWNIIFFVTFEQLKKLY